MNILFFLTPKSEVAYIFNDDTVRQVMEKMENRRYSCVPILNKEGCYVGSITEGDVLWGLKSFSLSSIKDTEKIPLSRIQRRYDYKPVHVGTNMEQLISRAMNQNFVPVVDDTGKFIGIVTRRDILRFVYQRLNELDRAASSKDPAAISENPE